MKCRACGAEDSGGIVFGLCWSYLKYFESPSGDVCLRACWLWFKEQGRVDDLHNHFDVAVDEWLEATK